MLELVEDTKTVIRNAFYVFKKLETGKILKAPKWTSRNESNNV